MSQAFIRIKAGAYRTTDVTGRVVRTLVSSGRKNEIVNVIWDCLDDASFRVPAGNYFYRCGDTMGKLEVVE